jgi:hypothetical protein
LLYGRRAQIRDSREEVSTIGETPVVVREKAIADRLEVESVPICAVK